MEIRVFVTLLTLRSNNSVFWLDKSVSHAGPQSVVVTTLPWQRDKQYRSETKFINHKNALSRPQNSVFSVVSVNESFVIECIKINNSPVLEWTFKTKLDNRTPCLIKRTTLNNKTLANHSLTLSFAVDISKNYINF